MISSDVRRLRQNRGDRLSDARSAIVTGTTKLTAGHRALPIPRTLLELSTDNI